MNEPTEHSEPNPYAPASISKASQDPGNFLASLASVDAAHANDAIVPPGQRPCPICGAQMRSEPRHSISIDVCQDHGIWLDSGKLDALTENIHVSERLKQRRDIEKIRKREKTKGVLFGWVSFFLD